jgi:glycosyltransferase involved in cell wall biosynthesis
MRIVFLTHNFPRKSGDLSGAFLATLAQALIRRGHEIRVLAPSDLGDIGAAEFEGVPVTRVRYGAPNQESLAYRGNMQDAIRSPAGWRALVGLWRALRRAAQSELERGADLVHAHWWVPGGLAAPSTAPLVLTVHGTDGVLLRRSALARWIAAPVFRRATLVSAVSKLLAVEVEATLGRHIPERWVHPMPALVDRFTRWSAGGAGLIVIARLTPQNRVALALHTAHQLVQQGRPLRLRIVGDGQERGALENLCDELNLRALVTFAGAVSPEKIAEMLDDSDAMLFPAVGEGFGLVAAESYMAGVPVAACRDGGGVLDIVPDRGAGRWAEPTPESLAVAVQSLLDDPEARPQAQRVGLEWRTRLSPDAVAAVCESWYQEALSAVSGHAAPVAP